MFISINLIEKKYIIFDDYNTRENQTARILLTQTNLATLKKYLSS